MPRTGSSEEIVLVTVTALSIVLGAYAYGGDVWQLVSHVIR